MNIKELDAKYIMGTYARNDVVFARGEGCYLFDENGKKYLDCLGGIATCSVGHGNSEVAEAVFAQAKNLISVSNLYYTKPQVLLAEKLSELSGLSKTFFCHSGTEANEAAIKLAKKVTGKKHFIAFKNSFHGRTSGSLALTWKPEFKNSFEPLMPKVSFAEFGEIESVKKLINDDTAAVFVEPIQGEAGIVVPPKAFLSDLKKLCQENNILLIVDEVQTGVGRTGKFFAYQHENIKPDIVTIAKGLGNGVPIAACLSDYEFASGDHGLTLGGNNLSATAALATIKYIEENNLLKNAEEIGSYLMSKFSGSRGKGLMIGIKIDKAKDVCKKALALGLVCNAPDEKTIRLLPPLTLTKNQADECINILEKAIKS